MAVYEWRCISPGEPTLARRCPAVALLPGDACGLPGTEVLLVLGGLSSNGLLSDRERSCFCAVLRQEAVEWRRLPNLPVHLRRHDASLARCNLGLFLFGGARGRVFYDDLQHVSLTLEEGCTFTRWGDGSPGPTPRSNTPLVGREGSLWVFGGCNLSGGTHLYSDTWRFSSGWARSAAAPSPPARSGHAAAWVGAALVIVGGWNGEAMLGDIWTLEGEVWAQVPFGIRPRACFGLGVLTDVIAVFGGLTDGYRLDEEDEQEPQDGNAAPPVHDSSLTVACLRSRRVETAVVVGQPPLPRAFVGAAVRAGPALVIAMGADEPDDEGVHYGDIYVCSPRTWSVETHALFPRAARDRVLMWLLVHQRVKLLPKTLWLLPLGWMGAGDWGWKDAGQVRA